MDDHNWTIVSAYNHMRNIYADANALTTPRGERFTFLTMAWADLSRNYRKKVPHRYPLAVAQVFAWSMSLTEELLRGTGGTILANAMAQKYPTSHCSYCKKFPCVCKQELRPVPTLTVTSTEQSGWTLSQWQQHLHALYGAANAAAGVPQAINRLGEEVVEVGALLNHVDGFNDSLDNMRKNIALEMTDVIAWMCTSSSLLEVDVQAAVRTLYGKGCPVCHTARCICPNFVPRPDAGTLTHRFMPAEELEKLCA